MLTIAPTEFIETTPAPDPNDPSRGLVALARGPAEHRFALEAPPAPYTFSVWFRRRRSGVPVSLILRDQQGQDAREVAPSDEWQRSSVTRRTQAGRLEAVIRVGAAVARPMDDVQVWCPQLEQGAFATESIPGQQLGRSPYVVLPDLAAARRVQQAVDALVGLPRQHDGIWHLTAAGVLRHPHVDEYAIPVTPPLVHLVRSGALLLDEPVALGPEWGGALPVPLAVLNHDPEAVRLYEQAFGIPGIVDPSGGLVESPTRGAVVEAAQDVVARLVRDLAAQPTDLHSMDPRAFEALIAHLLHRDGYEVHLTPASGDGGVDVLAVRSARVGRFLLGVQCKRYAPDRKIGVDVIRELVGTLDLEDLAAGAIVTTSFFTSGARELADRRRTKLTLQDFDDVRRWLLEHVAQR